MSEFKVPYIDLKKQYQAVRLSVDDAVAKVLQKGSFILRDEVRQFENKIAAYHGTTHALGVNSGTDAILLALKALDVGDGDEVITVAHTFIATVSAIVHCGAKPVFTDIDQSMNINPKLIESKITERTKCILPVHMNGKVSDMEKITEIAKNNRLAIVEDSCQAIGATINTKKAGTFGDIGCFSMHPMKILGVAGDGGFLLTNNTKLYNKCRIYRNHGQETKEKIKFFGLNSRLDNLQASIALAKLPHLDHWITRRIEIANRYTKSLALIKEVVLPLPRKDNTRDVYSSYVIRVRNRDQLFDWLTNHGIEVMIHWPVPIHLQRDLRLDHSDLTNTEVTSDSVISLPIFPEMTDNQVDYVLKTIHNFYTNG